MDHQSRTSADLPGLGINAIKDAAPLNRFHLLVVALCGGVVFFDGLDLLSISYAAPHIARALGLSAQQVGLVFSAGLLGLCIGSLAVGAFSDRRGRKPALLLSVLLFSAGSILTGLAEGLPSLLAWRLVTGLGLGAATPVVFALVTETCPRRLRASLNMIVYCGLMLGGLFGGAVAALVLDRFGWEWIFFIGGVLPLLYLPVLARWLPESIEHLLARGAPGRGSVWRLLAPDLAVRTAYATAGMFFCLLTLFVYASWLPSLLQRAGMSQNGAIVVTLVGQVGNLVGSLTIARLIVSRPAFRLVAFTFGGAALALVMVASAPPQLRWQIPFNLLVGACLGGSQNALVSLSPGLFPVEVRTTGVGWVRGVSQAGALAGPGITGVLLGYHWTPAQILGLVALAPLFAAGACWCLHVTQRHESQGNSR
jgi:AAHS family 4-hydroxybenzoate transporter-like MFS transporter